MSRDYDNAHLCAISLLRVWIDLIDSSGIDWKRFPDMSIDISECAIKLEKKKEKKLNFSWWMKMELSSIFFPFLRKYSSIMDIELNYVTSIFCVCFFLFGCCGCLVVFIFQVEGRIQFMKHGSLNILWTIRLWFLEDF